MSNKATCMYCGREIRVFKNGEIARHKASEFTNSSVNGGFHTKDCAGSALPPSSPENIEKEIERLQDNATMITPYNGELAPALKEAIIAERKRAITHLQNLLGTEQVQAPAEEQVQATAEEPRSVKELDYMELGREASIVYFELERFGVPEALLKKVDALFSRGVQDAVRVVNARGQAEALAKDLAQRVRLLENALE